jgi:hypothetical protein
MDCDIQARDKSGRKFYPEATITLILEEVTKGHPITEILSNPAFPCEASFYRWVSLDDKLAARLTAAREQAKQKGN